MFAARLISYSAKSTAALIFCLLVSLPALTLAEDTMTETPSAATDAAPAPAENITPANDQAEKQKGRVARAIFTSAIVDREPVDNLATISSDTSQIFFFSDLRDLAGQIVTHRWEYNDKVMAEVTFKVGNGARWRVYSSKNLLPEWTGQWTVVVSNESGWPIEASTFEYSAEMADKTMTETSATVSP